MSPDFAVEIDALDFIINDEEYPATVRLSEDRLIEKMRKRNIPKARTKQLVDLLVCCGVFRAAGVFVRLNEPDSAGEYRRLQFTTARWQSFLKDHRRLVANRKRADARADAPKKNQKKKRIQKTATSKRVMDFMRLWQKEKKTGATAKDVAISFVAENGLEIEPETLLSDCRHANYSFRE